MRAPGIFLTLLLTLLCLSPQGWAQQRKTARPQAEPLHLLVLVDCSESMWGAWQSDAKIKVTQRVLTRFMDSVAMRGGINVALRTFGRQSDGSHGTQLLSSFETDNPYWIQNRLKGLVPGGRRNIGEALGAARGDFQNPNSQRNIILLITDGTNHSDRPLCHTAIEAQTADGRAQVFTVGIGAREDFESNPECIGHFQFVEREEDFSSALFEMLRLANEQALVVLQAIDSDGQRYETSFPVVFYDSLTGAALQSAYYQHRKGKQPDTLSLSPLRTYNITLHTRPETTFVGRRFAANHTSTLTAMIEQGTLRVRLAESKATWAVPDYDVQVHRHGDVKVLHRQRAGETVDYLSGSYDIEVLTLPPTKLIGVEVRGDAATDLMLPAPGLLTLGRGKQAVEGRLFAVTEEGLVPVYDLESRNANERVLLMPGNYVAVVRDAAGTTAGKSLHFEIASGETRHLNLGERK